MEWKWENISKTLSGQNGLVYLMFLGRQTTGEEVANELKDKNLKILADPADQVYTALSSLLKKGYICEVGKKGHYKIRVAELGPIIETCKKLKIPFSKVEEDMVKTMGRFMKYFPPFVNHIMMKRKYTIRKMKWEFIFEKLYWRYLSYFSLRAFQYNSEKLSFLAKKDAKDLSELWKFSWAMYMSWANREMSKMYGPSSYLDMIYKKTTKKEQFVFVKHMLEDLNRMAQPMMLMLEKMGVKSHEWNDFLKDLSKGFHAILTTNENSKEN